LFLAFARVATEQEREEDQQQHDDQIDPQREQGDLDGAGGLDAGHG
jgi:hypothetical protein